MELRRGRDPGPATGARFGGSRTPRHGGLRARRSPPARRRTRPDPQPHPNVEVVKLPDGPASLTATYLTGRPLRSRRRLERLLGGWLRRAPLPQPVAARRAGAARDGRRREAVHRARAVAAVPQPRAAQARRQRLPEPALRHLRDSPPATASAVAAGLAARTLAGAPRRAHPAQRDERSAARALRTGRAPRGDRALRARAARRRTCAGSPAPLLPLLRAAGADQGRGDPHRGLAEGPGGGPGDRRRRRAEAPAAQANRGNVERALRWPTVGGRADPPVPRRDRGGDADARARGAAAGAAGGIHNRNPGGGPPASARSRNWWRRRGPA